MTTLAQLFSFLKGHIIYFETNKFKLNCGSSIFIKRERFTGTKSGGKKNF